MSIPNDSAANELQPVTGRGPHPNTRRTVAIIGASAERWKFGNKSVRAHLRAGFEVYPVNPRGGEVEGLVVYRSLAEVPVERLDRVSIYVPPEIGLKLLEEIARKGCRELWFNPGSESDRLLAEAHRLGLNPIVACSIVDVGFNPQELEAT